MATAYEGSQLHNPLGSSFVLYIRNICFSVWSCLLFIDGNANMDDEEGRDDGGEGKFEYVTSEERGSSQVCPNVFDRVFTERFYGIFEYDVVIVRACMF